MPLGQNTDNRTMIWDYKLITYSFQFKATPGGVKSTGHNYKTLWNNLT